MFEKPRDILVNYAGFYGIPRAEALLRADEELKRAQLWDKADSMARTLSGGMKRRLMIARAMMTRPRLLILDEPTAGVDIEIRRSMWEFLKRINREGITIILTTHYLEEAENLCRRVGIIDHGQIIEFGSTRDLLAKLHTETFILNLRESLAKLPPLDGYTVSQIDDTTLEVEISRSQNVNGLFALLTDAGVQVLSMRNKANRLEELFVRLVENKQ
jgi:ABC-2 type transport system ATP-binding protein